MISTGEYRGQGIDNMGATKGLLPRLKRGLQDKLGKRNIRGMDKP